MSADGVQEARYAIADAFHRYYTDGIATMSGPMEIIEPVARPYLDAINAAHAAAESAIRAAQVEEWQSLAHETATVEGKWGTVEGERDWWRANAIAWHDQVQDAYDQRDRAAAIRAADARTLSVLREVEWSEPAFNFDLCPWCSAKQADGHEGGCKLAAELRRLESALEGT